MDPNQKWLIWSIEHNAWWGPNQHGYVGKRDAAGQYSYAEAAEIVRGANWSMETNRDGVQIPNEAMVPA